MSHPPLAGGVQDFARWGLSGATGLRSVPSRPGQG